MTTFIITATRENGTTFTDKFTAATAAEARKDFREVYRHGEKYSITACEVYAENISATKEQEREALAKVKAIIEQLGPDSYLAAAFEGCFEDAEQNIENDWACSMKQRAEAAEKRAAELERKLKTAELNERDLREAIKKAKDEASSTITALQQQLLSEDDLEDIRQLVSEYEYKQEEATEEAAAEIVEHADDPSSKAFTEAVRLHRAYKQAAEYGKNLRQRVEAAQAARHNAGA